MKNNYKMTQCLLTCEKESTVVWIPADKAKLKKIKINGIHGIWTVVERYATDWADKIIENASDYRRHRDATDI